MSKLSAAVKGLINAPFARGGQMPAPARIREVYERIANEAREKQYGRRTWLTASAAATFTLNSPESLLVLHKVATTAAPSVAHTPLAAAELIREVGLKCISFNGIPRTINCLNAFRADTLDEPWAAQLETRSSRSVADEKTLAAVRKRGSALWESVYTPLDEKLYEKLALAHPDLPVYILGSHYGPLLADPERNADSKLAATGRCLTSIIAISCLRAQTGVGPQVLSHVYGLRKGISQGAHEQEAEASERDALVRVSEDEGLLWLLKSVDTISKAIGSNFVAHDGGPERLSKL